MNGVIRVGRKYQMVFPQVLREKLGIREGDEILYQETPRGILMYPKPADPIEFMRGLGAETWKGESVQNYIERERESWDS